MNRKTFLAAGGLALLPSFAFADDRRRIRLKDAPVRAALELVLKGFGQGNYVIEGPVMGFLSGDWHVLTLGAGLDRLCAANQPRLVWKTINRVVQVKAAESIPGGAEALAARLAGLEIPTLADGIRCRVSGILDDGARKWAIVEIATPVERSSTGVSVVTVGGKITVHDAVYQVSEIRADSVLLSGPRTLEVPFSGLMRSGKSS